MDNVGKNYQWWQQAGWDWYAELSLRRLYDDTYARQEEYLKDFFGKKAREWLAEKGRPLRVLEFGCGFGRHLKYLHQMEGMEVWGCEQSPAMLSAAEALLAGRFPELRGRLAIVNPTGRLPYDDGAFDVVYTVSVLIHVPPADLYERVAELRRVAGHMVLNLELPPAPHSFFWDEAHEGCWLHNYVDAYQAAGPCFVEVDADTLGPRVAICKAYLDGAIGTVRMLYDGQWAEDPEGVRRAIVGAALSYGRFCRERVHEACGRQVTACQDLRFTNEDLRAANGNLRAANENLRAANDTLRAVNENVRSDNEKLRGQVHAFRNSRAVRAAEWLSSHRLLARTLRATFDAVSGFRRRALRLLGLRREAEPKAPSPAGGAAVAQSAAAPESKESEGGGPKEGEGDA